MERVSSIKKWQVLGIVGVLAMAMVAATAIAGALVSNQASAHGGDSNLVHACVNSTNGEIRIAHPGAGTAIFDCTTIPAGTWTNLDLENEWLGGGTGSVVLADSADKVGIGTDSPIAGFQYNGDRFILTANSGTEKSFINMNLAGALQVQTNGAAMARFEGNGDVLLGIAPSGRNVGIGTTLPQSALHVNGYTQLDTVVGAPPAADCDAVLEHGRMKVDPTTGISLLYICTEDGWVSK